jgi:exportin-1
VLKICLDYWNFFVPDVYSSACTVDVGLQFAFATSPAGGGSARKQLYAATLSKLRALMIARMAKPEEASRRPPRPPGQPERPLDLLDPGLMRRPAVRHSMAATALHSVRTSHARRRCACPPPGPPAQVIVVEDENGNVVRETMKDTDVLARYKTMHETLVYLSHLDHEDTEQQMLEKLRLQVRAREAAGRVMVWACGCAVVPGGLPGRWRRVGCL